MGEAKRRKKLDAKWGKPHWKPQMEMEEYREWGLHEFSRDSLICFHYFKDTFVDEIPMSIREKAPKWIEQQKGQVKVSFLLGIMFDELNQDFLSKKSAELSVKYKLSQEKMYFQVLKGFLIASNFFQIEDEDEYEEEERESLFFYISYEELEVAERRFKKQINPVYQKCTDLGIDLTMYEDIINTSFVPEELEQAVIHLTLSLRDYPEIIDEIIDTLPQFWILSETRKTLEKFLK
ncbi:hypothetical protein [Crocosphaera sp. Alani8]|uniref:hypothetical protein n=1 Tax=Crocosphaera sp. Alani8 TaxID=3038952 RepID=UPI00313AC813